WNKCVGIQISQEIGSQLCRYTQQIVDRREQPCVISGSDARIRTACTRRQIEAGPRRVDRRAERNLRDGVVLTATILIVLLIKAHIPTEFPLVRPFDPGEIVDDLRRIQPTYRVRLVDIMDSCVVERESRQVRGIRIRIDIREVELESSESKGQFIHLR